MIAIVLLAAACGGDSAPSGAGDGLLRSWRAAPVLTPASSGTEHLLQAVSVVNGEVIWVSGHGGRWSRSVDGGVTWESGVVAGEDSLQFRDVHAVDADSAFLLSAGPGELSRIHRTTDGGRSWSEVWRNRDPEGFYDCFSFWDPELPGTPRRGIAIGDEIRGETMLVGSNDGGLTWSLLPDEARPPAGAGEGSFAASGTCLVTVGSRHGWVATGATDVPRVLRTTDSGATWHAAEIPLPGGGFAGSTSLAFRDTLTGWVFGGNLGEPDGRTENVAMTVDGGVTWRSVAPSRMTGAIYGSALVPGTDPTVLVTVGPGGADLSLDGGASWAALDTVPYWAAGFASPSAGWLVGPGGRLTRVDLRLERMEP